MLLHKLDMQQLMHNQNTSLAQNTQHDTCMAFELAGCCHRTTQWPSLLSLPMLAEARDDPSIVPPYNQNK